MGTLQKPSPKKQRFDIYTKKLKETGDSAAHSEPNSALSRVLSYTSISKNNESLPHSSKVLKFAKETISNLTSEDDMAVDFVVDMVNNVFAELSSSRVDFEELYNAFKEFIGFKSQLSKAEQDLEKQRHGVSGLCGLQIILEEVESDLNRAKEDAANLASQVDVKRLLLKELEEKLDERNKDVCHLQEDSDYWKRFIQVKEEERIKSLKRIRQLENDIEQTRSQCKRSKAKLSTLL